MGGVEKITNGKERNGNLSYTDPVLTRQGSRESCNNRATGTFAVRQYECKASVQVGEYFGFEGLMRADKIQDSFPTLDMKLVFLGLVLLGLVFVKLVFRI